MHTVLPLFQVSTNLLLCRLWSCATSDQSHALQTLELYYLWYRKYFYYAAVVSAISWLAIAGLVVVLSDQHKKLVGLVNKRHVVPIVERGWVRAAPSHKLVPGDVVVLQKGRALCDMVLLRGSCLVEESMLSGEVWAACPTPGFRSFMQCSFRCSMTHYSTHRSTHSLDQCSYQCSTTCSTRLTACKLTHYPTQRLTCLNMTPDISHLGAGICSSCLATSCVQQCNAQYIMKHPVVLSMRAQCDSKKCCMSFARSSQLASVYP